jgi:hypothetical protein
LQVAGISWLLIGKTGLYSFITENVPRLRSIIDYNIKLESLSLTEVKNAINCRLEDCAIKNTTPKNPLEEDLINELFYVTGGSLREIFQIAVKLCYLTSNTPIYDRINLSLASKIISEILSLKVKDLESNPLQSLILKTIIKNPNFSQNEIIKKIKKKQTSVSRAIKSLVSEGFLFIIKNGREVNYRISSEIFLASKYLWK